MLWLSLSVFAMLSTRELALSTFVASAVCCCAWAVIFPSASVTRAVRPLTALAVASEASCAAFASVTSVITRSSIYSE